jgi:hypothetical protein
VGLHSGNPSYLRGRDRRMAVQGQPREKLVRPHLNKEARYGGVPIVPPAQEAEVEGSLSESSPWQKTGVPI